VTSAGASGYDGSTASASANISLSPSPGIFDTVTGTTPFIYGASAGGNVNTTLSYSFIIVNKANQLLQMSIPVIVNASGGMSFTGVGSAPGPLLSQFSVSGILDDQLSNTIFAGSLYPGPTSWSDNNIYTMETDIVYNVNLIVQADLIVYGGSGGGTGTVSAYVDPTFALGPGVIDPGQYSFVFSPGIGAIPEPSTWAMMLVGFAGLFFGARKGIAVASDA
jgi:PEP-CTERM motif